MSTLSPQKALKNHVNRVVSRLQTMLNDGHPAARRDAAVLRRALNQPAGSVPEAFACTLSELPEDLVGTTDSPSRGESIAHVTICLFAMHAQAATQFPQQPSISFGTALQHFIHASGTDNVEESPLMKRIQALLTSDSFEECTYHLRSLIQQMRAADIGFNYGELAEDLWWFCTPSTRNSVRLKWSRDIYIHRSSLDESHQTTATATISPLSHN